MINKYVELHMYGKGHECCDVYLPQSSSLSPQVVMSHGSLELKESNADST